MTNKLILVSSSPRRQELLNQVKIPFTIRKPDVDESQIKSSDPVEKVKQLALLKGKNVPLHCEDEVILSADTVVSFHQTIFGKPKDSQEAAQMITAFSGNVHEVFTGVMIRSHDDEIVFVERTKVEFWPLSKEEIDWYVNRTIKQVHTAFKVLGQCLLSKLSAITTPLWDCPFRV